MKTSAIIAAAGLAAASEAILLPPGSYEIEADEPTFKALPFEIAAKAEDQIVKVNCPGCPIVVSGQSGRYRTLPGDSSHLELDFAIHHAPSGDRLLLNGFELYPEADPLGPLPLRAAVKPDTNDYATQHLPIAKQDLGFSLRVNPALGISLDGKNQLVGLDLQVIEIGNTFVQGLDSVHVKMVKKADTGALMIAQIDKGESENPPVKGSKEPCQTILCALRGSMANIMNQVRPHRCNHPGHHMSSLSQMMGHGGNEAPHHSEQAHHKAQNKVNDGKGQIHHHPQRSWASLFKQLSYSIILPILIGIVAGISVSIVGMIIGTLAVGTWRVFVRGKSFFPTRHCLHRRTCSGKAAANDSSLVEEKAGLMTNTEDDTLPMYTDEEDKRDSV